MSAIPKEIDGEAFERGRKALEGLVAGVAGAPPAQAVSSPAAGVPAGAWPTPNPSPRPQAIQKIGYNHEALIDLIIANPAASQNALADHFGLTPSWISQVMSSDAFQSALDARREQIVDPVLRLTVEQNFKALVSRSLDILREKLNKPASEIPDMLALRALEISSRAAGYGVKDSTPAAAGTTVDVHVHLEQMGQGLVALLARKKLEAGVAAGGQGQGAGQSQEINHLAALTQDFEEGDFTNADAKTS